MEPNATGIDWSTERNFHQGSKTIIPGGSPILRVMIVEDYPDAAASLAILLRLAGHDVRICSSGPEALDAAPAYCPDAALIDIMLPGMDGYKVARSMRELSETRETLLIAVTGFADEAHRSRSEDAGFAYHLVKPMDFDDLSKILTTLAGDIRGRIMRGQS